MLNAAAARAAEENEETRRVRRQLEEDLGLGLDSMLQAVPDADGVEALERSLSSDGRTPASIAATMAANELAAHTRLQSPGADPDTYNYRGCVTCLLGQTAAEASPSEGGVSIASLFPWTGEATRSALPTRPPPTLCGWFDLRARGETASAYWDLSVPQRACTLRGDFARAALRSALRGLGVLHGAAMLHGALSASNVMLSSEDDRLGAKVKGRLADFSFARDLRTFELISRCDSDGVPLPLCASRPDLLATDLLERAADAGAGAELAAFGAADDVRSFGVLFLQACLVPAGARAEPAEV